MNADPRILLVVGAIALLCAAARSPVRTSTRSEDDDATRDATCMVCHPGAFAAVKASVHAPLFEREATRDRTCSVCHVGTGPHVASARRPEATLVRPPPVAASDCRTCHGDRDYATDLGAHPWRSRESLTKAALEGRATTTPIVLPRERGIAAFEWRGLVEFGHRFVSRSGSRDRYATDVDLDAGFRLVDARLEGDGETDWLDRIDLRARDVGDPWRRLSAEFGKRDRYEARFDAESRVFEYRARGDYARVSRETDQLGATLDVELSDAVTLTFGFEHHEDDGRWLTQRLAGRGASPLTPVTSVDSPRRLRADTTSVGLHGDLDGLRYRIGVDWLDQFEVERWTFDRPAPGNPALRESETFQSRGATTGPTFAANAEREFGAFRVELDARRRDLDRDLGALGRATGFDTVEFVTDTTARVRGDAATTWLGIGVEYEVHDRVVVVGDLRYRDHLERLHLDQVDVTTFPGSGGSVRVDDVRTQRTEQRRYTGSIGVDVEPFDDFVVGIGYGFAHERLVLPELPSGGLDPTRGTITDDGVLASLRWKFAPRWTVSADVEDFGQTGLALVEQQERDARSHGARLRYATESVTVEVATRSRRARNAATDFRIDHDRHTATVTWNVDEAIDLLASYAFSQIDSRTRTNFYFDPDPTPVPTLVGFRGDTHTMAGGLELRPRASVRWRTDAAWTRTDGSFDVRTFDLRSDLSVEVFAGGAVGARYQRLHYAQGGGGDDFDADLVLVYWRQRFGAER